VFSGYAGWGEGQLDDELRSGGWVVQPAAVDLAFHDPPEALWAHTMAQAGGPYKFFGLMPPEPELN
jgi:putative transcriptional regulator